MTLRTHLHIKLQYKINFSLFKDENKWYCGVISLYFVMDAAYSCFFNLIENYCSQLLRILYLTVTTINFNDNNVEYYFPQFIY